MTTKLDLFALDQIPHELSWYFALSSALIYVFFNGRADERRSALVLLVSSLLTGPLTTLFAVSEATEAILTVGALVNGYFLVLALRSDRWWPMWVTAFLLISNAAMSVPLVDPASRNIAAYFGSVLWDYLILLALVIGTALEARSDAQASQNEARLGI